MALPFEDYQRFSVEETLGIGDASKTLMAAATGVQYFITTVILTSLVAAAQTIYVGDSSGTKKALSLPISLAAGTQYFSQLLEGLAMTVGEAVIIKPAAAGPSVHVVCEGYAKRGIV